MFTHQENRNLSGFTLIEVSLALVIAAILAAILLQNNLTNSKKSLGAIQADQLIKLAEAVDNYSNLYRKELTASGPLNIDFNNDNTTDFSIPELPPSGASDGGKLNPRIDQLISAGVLTASFQNRPVASDGNFVVRLKKTPSSCSVAANNCRVDGYIAINLPVTSSGQNTNAGQYDGKVISGILERASSSFFVNLTSSQYPTTVGGGGEVIIDLNNNGAGDLQSGDIGVRAGTVGVLVGSTVSRLNTTDPIAGVDYCPGNRLLTWYNTSTSTSGQICQATIYSDTPTGLTFLAEDQDGTGNAGLGKLVVRCVFNPTTGVADLEAKTRCCSNSQGCNPTNS